MTTETFTVAELTRAISYALEDAFADDVWITGEIDGLHRSRGHVYFDLVEPRDDIGQPATAQLAVALFKMNKEVVNRTLKRAGIARIDNGVRVRIRGAVAFNERNGRLQVRMTGIDPVYTLGQLTVDRERVLRSLREAGLLDRNAQMPLALVPLRVGLVTSAGSAAYHDFVHELDVSGLAFHLTFVDAKVQGVGAGHQVMRALRQLARTTDIDVIALVRGGGSSADLATFDDEQLARTIATLDLPVLTGVGHEVDRSIADDVAHTAYKTPTACAAALVSRVRAYRDTTEELWSEIARVAQLAVREQHDLVRMRARASARAARSSLRAADTDAGNLATRLAREAIHTASRAEHRLERRRDRSARAAREHLARGTARVDRSAQVVRIRAPRQIITFDRQLDLTEARLRALDPTRLLARGWSITRRADGTLVRSVHEVEPDDIVLTRVGDGAVRSIVTDAVRASEAGHHG